jgi:hypothetical protein
MAEVGHGDAGALALGLRHGATGLGLRALAAKAIHAAAAAPERLTDIYDNAAAGWLGGAVFPPKLRTPEPLPISRNCWKAFWTLVRPTEGDAPQVYAEQMMRLAGELDPRINARMAAAALEFPGVAEVATGDLPEPYDPELLAGYGPASLGFAVREELLRAGGGLSAGAYWTNALPFLRHMPAPLNHINMHVIQAMPIWCLVAGYSPRALDRVAFGGFLMGQVGHHYSALASAVTLTSVAVMRPPHVEVILDCLFKGWAHGRESPPLIQVAWEPLWRLRVDEAREALQMTAFQSPRARPALPAAGA